MSHPPRLAPNIVALCEGDRLVKIPVNFLCAHDGSSGAQAALDLVMDFFMIRREKTNLDAIHIFDAEKQGSLAANFTKESIEKDFNDRVGDRQKRTPQGNKFQLHCEEKTEKMRGQKHSEGKMIVRYSFDQEKVDRTIDFLVAGFHGTKSEATREQLLSSDVNYILQYSRCSTILVKTPFQLAPESPLHFMCAVDTHKWSEKALYDTLCLTQGGDRITLFHVYDAEKEGSKDEAEQWLNTLVNALNTKLQNPRDITLVVQARSADSIADDILDYAVSSQADMLCMGTDAARLRRQGLSGNYSYLGSVAGKVVCCTQIPVCIAHYDESFKSATEDGETLVPEVPSEIPEFKQSSLSETKFDDLEKWRKK